MGISIICVRGSGSRDHKEVYQQNWLRSYNVVHFSFWKDPFPGTRFNIHGKTVLDLISSLWDNKLSDFQEPKLFGKLSYIAIYAFCIFLFWLDVFTKYKNTVPIQYLEQFFVWYIWLQFSFLKSYDYYYSRRWHLLLVAGIYGNFNASSRVWFHILMGNQ